ncbi:uncharacterized protein [Lepisosteus oculatus]|uniref:uncharacterized protein isoform X1 n=1 Tax=Lepisosteus oculatus TaxID=7918 RepID=UPI0035F5223B
MKLIAVQTRGVVVKLHIQQVSTCPFSARSEVHSLQSGASLSLPLHTAGPVEVLFDPGGSAQSRRVLLSRAGLPGPRYKQRVSVQNSSLTLRSLTPADQGNYTVRDLQGNTISTVTVTVDAHRDTVTLQPGASLSVPLFTGEPVEVLFDPAGGGNWTSVCSVQNSTARCVPQYRDRVSVQDGSLTLHSLTPADQGNYTVRDLQGNTISTVIFTVGGPAPPGRTRLLSILIPVLTVLSALGVLAGLYYGKTRRENQAGDRPAMFSALRDGDDGETGDQEAQNWSCRRPQLALQETHRQGEREAGGQSAGADIVQRHLEQLGFRASLRSPNGVGFLCRPRDLNRQTPSSPRRRSLAIEPQS